MADYFNYQRRQNNSLTRDRLNAPLPPVQTPGGRRHPLAEAGSMENLRRNPASSIRIRRLPSGNNLSQQSRPTSSATPIEEDTAVTGRRRSSLEPQRYSGGLAPPALDLARQRTAEPSGQSGHMPTITEGQQSQQRPAPSNSSGGSYHEAVETPMPDPTPVRPTPGIDEYDAATSAPASRVTTGASAMNSAGNAARENRGLKRIRTNAEKARARGEYDSEVVDLLDLVGKCSNALCAKR